MIEKLMLAEYALQYNLNRAQTKLLAFKSIKKLLSEIDFNVEEIPDDPLRFRQLLESLKGEQLTALEMELVNELVDSDKLMLKAMNNLS
ncbi:MAG TPA: hypothetical protein VIN10_14225 [Bacteroidales bacterium]